MMLGFLSYGSLKMAAYLNEDESDGEIRYIQFDGHCYDRKSVTFSFPKFYNDVGIQSI